MFFELLKCFALIPIFLMGLMFFIFFVLIPFAFLFASWYMRVKERKIQRRKKDGVNVAFFHPYCNSGGGGERVLWVAIKAILSRYPKSNIHIYTVETAATHEVLAKVQELFNVAVPPDRISLVRLSLGRLIEASSYPYLTLLLQSVGSMVLGFEALMKLNPDVYIETTGFAFTCPLFRVLAQAHVGSYVHYPAITSDMARRVRLRSVQVNNTRLVTANPLLTYLKLFYYCLFSRVYGWVGSSNHVVMANGSWTHDHLQQLWGPRDLRTVYPPCEVEDLMQLTPRDAPRIRVVAVAQFRPEKEHPMMMQAFYELRTLLANNEPLWDKMELVLVGGCRNAADVARVAALRSLARHLSLERHVLILTDVSRADLLALLPTCRIAIHTMLDEHFGISVVEAMAAGLVVVAHRSGGPLRDIVREGAARTGFLAQSPQEYARALLEAMALPASERAALVARARQSVERFSTERFEKAFLGAIEPLMDGE